jgi:hypothetical protein
MPIIGKEKENDTSDANKNSEASIKFSPYDGFGLRANLNGARFKGSKNKFAPMQVEGNTVTQHIPPKSANISESNPRERMTSLDFRVTDTFQKGLGETFTKLIKEKNKLFDPVLHKKLELLLKMLEDEEKEPETKKVDSSYSNDTRVSFC